MMKRDYLLLMGLLLLGCWLRFGGLAAKSLWLDEALSWRLVDFGIVEMIQRTGEAHTTHPPLYFLLLYLWRAIWGDSECALRSLAAVCGLFTILGTYLFVRELSCFGSHHVIAPSRFDAGRGAALLAAALISVNPLQIHSSQQVRGYSLATALFAWSSWALFRALQSRQWKWISWSAYAILALALCYTHYFGLVSVLAQILFVVSYLCFGCDTCPPPAANSNCQTVSSKPHSYLIAHDKVSLAKWAFVVALILVVGYLPWLGTFLGQSEVARNAWTNRAIGMQEVSRTFRFAMFATSGEPQLPNAPLDWAAGALLAGTFGLLAFRGKWRGHYLVLTGVLPVVVALTYSSYSSRTIFACRYLSFAQIAWLVGFAVLVYEIPYRCERTLLAAWFVTVSLFSCFSSWDVIGPRANPGLRAAMQRVLRHREANEPIVARTPFVLFGSLYYARGNDQPLLLVSVPGRAAQRGSTHLNDEELVTPAGLLEMELDGVWFISSASYDKNQIVTFPVPEHWHLVETWQFDQDYWNERPVIVEHFRIDRRTVAGARQATATEAKGER